VTTSASPRHAVTASPNLRLQVLLWAAHRISAVVLAICVFVHLAVIIYAVRGGLTAAEILGRTSGSIAWAVFYGLFVAAAAIHAPLGMRTVLSEHFNWRGRSLGIVTVLIGIGLAFFGWRAVYAVVGAGPA